MLTNSPLSFNTLLNMLDGVSANEGLVFFFTTNRPEALDPALTRPGRCDMAICMGNATEDMAKRLFLRFFPGEDQSAETFGKKLPSETSMAVLQEYLLGHRGNPEAAAAGTVPPPEFVVKDIEVPVETGSSTELPTEAKWEYDRVLGKLQKAKGIAP